MTPPINVADCLANQRCKQKAKNQKTLYILYMQQVYAKYFSSYFPFKATPSVFAAADTPYAGTTGIAIDNIVMPSFISFFAHNNTSSM